MSAAGEALALALGLSSPWTVTNRSGWAVSPGSLTMAFLCNGDNQPGIDRARFTIGAPRPLLMKAD